MKQCFKCKKLLSLDNFYKHNQMKDGYLNKCKECSKLDVRVNYKKNIEHFREYDKKRNSLPHRVKLRSDYSKTQAGKNSHAKALIKQKIKSPKKYKARILFRSAVRSNFLTKPQCCEKCLLDKKLHGHHCDYNKPLDVMWLCTSCHRDWHKNNKAIE